MRRILIAIVVLYSVIFSLTPASSADAIKIKIKTTWKIAGRPQAYPQLIPFDDRVFLSFNSDNLTTQQDQLYWLDRNFKVHAIVLNSKQKSRSAGFIAFNNQYFFTAHLGAKPRRGDDTTLLSIDAKDKIKKWSTPGYTACRTSHVLGELLYINCFKNPRSKTYNVNRAGVRSPISIYDIDAIFAISKNNTVSKVVLPTGRSVDMLWRGQEQILLQSDSTDKNQLSYYYLENGKINYQFDLPNSVGVRQLTPAGWALNLPNDINAPLFACPTTHVLGSDGQFLRVTSPPECVPGIPDKSIVSLLNRGYPESKKYDVQAEEECKKQLVAKAPKPVGFFNGHVLCYNDWDNTDNLIHAFPSTYKRPALPSDVFPVINQKTVPKTKAYSPEETTPASTSGFPTSCPAVENIGNKNEPKVVGFKFDATGQNFVRIAEGTVTGVKEPTGLVGCYIDFETLSWSPGGNTFAIGSINHDSTGYYWINQAGIRWGLKLSGSVMKTSLENPYYSDGDQFLLQSK